MGTAGRLAAPGSPWFCLISAAGSSALRYVCHKRRTEARSAVGDVWARLCEKLAGWSRFLRSAPGSAGRCAPVAPCSWPPTLCTSFPDILARMFLLSATQHLLKAVELQWERRLSQLSGSECCWWGLEASPVRHEKSSELPHCAVCQQLCWLLTLKSTEAGTSRWLRGKWYTQTQMSSKKYLATLKVNLRGADECKYIKHSCYTGYRKFLLCRAGAKFQERQSHTLTRLQCPSTGLASCNFLAVRRKKKLYHILCDMSEVFKA